MKTLTNWKIIHINKLPPVTLSLYTIKYSVPPNRVLLISIFIEN